MSKLLEIQMAKLVNMSPDALAAEMQAKSARQVMAEFLFALSQLMVHHRVPYELADVCVNYHGAAQRVDVATVTAAGEHIDQWVLGLNACVQSEELGQPALMPGMDGQTH